MSKLRQIEIKTQIRKLNKLLAEKRAKADSFKKREDDLTAALDELEQNESATDEAIKAIEDELEALKSEIGDADIEAEIADIEEQISDLSTELEEIEKAADDAGKTKKSSNPNSQTRNEKGGLSHMKKRTILGRLDPQTRDAIMHSEEMRTFLSSVRTALTENRAVSGSEILIPDNVLSIIRDDLDKYSKLIAYITVKTVKGTARQPIAGTIPEAIWTEAVASLKELNIGFNEAEVDGYKIAGFIAISNSILEDSDINLATEIIEALAQAIGLGIDKAVLYGTGVKMPLGTITRLAQTSKPAGYSNKARPWQDLSTSNIIKLTAAEAKLTGVDFFAMLINYLEGIPAENYSDGKTVWCMHRKTFTKIKSLALAFNAAGTLVAAADDEMPVIGGKVLKFDFMPEGDIAGGYGSNYLLAERAGANMEQSKDAQFIEDNTVFKGTARYDGVPTIPESFMLINILGKDPATSIDFAGQENSDSATE